MSRVIVDTLCASNVLCIVRSRAAGAVCIPEHRIWSIFLQIVLGLHHLHRSKALHRDMKAANVFLHKDGSSGEHIVKIGDLGVAKLMSTSTAFANTVVGTPYNLSPELCQDQVSSSNTIVITKSSCDAATCYHKYMQDVLQCAALLAFKVISANKKSGVIVPWSNLRRCTTVLACVVSADTKFEVQTAVRMCDNHNTQWYCNSFAIGTLWYIVYYSLSYTLHICCCSQTCQKLQPYNDKSDIWAVGVILYQCCMSGHHPFEAKNQCALILKIIKGKYDPIPEDRVSNGLRAVARHLLMHDQTRRPSTQHILHMAVVQEVSTHIDHTTSTCWFAVACFQTTSTYTAAQLQAHSDELSKLCTDACRVHSTNTKCTRCALVQE
eukprot:16609-Heterococcus_DN1.PRE.2